MPTDTPTTDQVIACMQRDGGSFIRALAAAWLVADPENRALIETTWAHRFNHYRALAHYSDQVA